MPVFSGAGAVWAMKLGDFEPTPFPGTMAGVQAALDYPGAATGCHVFIGACTITGITNLTCYGKTTICGAGAQFSILQRSPGATGITIREKTAGEGNTQGAAGIILKDISIQANGSAGDGINFGNQGGASFTSNASLIDMFVRDFTGGTAITLNANAIHCRNVWTHVNQVGFYLGGGSSHYDGLWAEANTVTGVRVASPQNTFTHLHLEDNAVGAASLVEVGIAGGPAGQAQNNIFLGVVIQLGANMTNLLVEKTNTQNTQWLGVRVLDGGHTYSNLIYDEVASTGTGATTFHVPFMFEMAQTGVQAWLRDAPTGWRLPLDKDTGYQQQGVSSMASASSVSPGVGSWFTVSGTTTIDNITSPTKGRTIWLKTSGALTIKNNSGGTGNIRLVGSADVAMTANDVMQLTSDGTLWWQSAPVVVI